MTEAVLRFKLMHDFALLYVVYGYHNLTTFGHEAGQIINLDTFTVCGINFFFNSQYSWITGY